MTQKIDDKALGKVTGGAVDVSASSRSTFQAPVGSKDSAVPPTPTPGGGSTTPLPGSGQPVDMQEAD